MMTIWLPGLTIPTTAYANSGGTGDRTGSITVTQTVFADPLLGAPGKIVDGSFTADSSGSLTHSGGGSVMGLTGGTYFQFDFGSAKYIDEMKLYVSASPSWGVWKVQVSSDGSNFADLNTFTWSSATQTQSVTGMDAAGYRYLGLTKVGDVASTVKPWFEEVEFKIAAGAT